MKYFSDSDSNCEYSDDESINSYEDEWNCKEKHNLFRQDRHEEGILLYPRRGLGLGFICCFQFLIHFFRPSR